eukprot:TRINITY_DN11577_c0_g1_i1.p1 TRINITY_DN11577_c0_g1~~TRINITY_DN11577_c0_g1_i1.p1  ORF type:complete len:613 (-),score=97.93 TRINITY_DN11577_c0_g1_i1:38-1876(-)
MTTRNIWRLVVVLVSLFIISDSVSPKTISNLEADSTLFFDTIGCAIFTDSDCIFLTNPNNCLDLTGTIDENNCSHVENLGSCCLSNNFCLVSTKNPCLVIPDDTVQWIPFTENQTTCSCPLRQSCCLPSQGCIEDMNEDDCNSIGGNYALGGCNSQACLYDYEGIEYGACIDTYNTCRDVTYFRCGTGSYHPGATCAMLGLTDEIQRMKDFLPGPPPDDGFNGRCCLSSPDRCIAANSSDDCPNDWYQEGYGCIDELQEPYIKRCGGQGSCLRDDGNCYDNQEFLCLATNGLWSIGAGCNYDYFTEYPCYYNGQCRYLGKTTCDLFNGWTDQTLNAVCNTTHGVCCNKLGDISSCDGDIHHCSYSHTYVNTTETCSTFDCLSIDYPGCCISGICVSDLAVEGCYASFNTPIIQGCPNTGTCNGGDVSFKSQDIQFVSVEVSVREVSINSNSSKIDFGKSDFDRVTFNLLESTIDFSVNITIKNSVINIDSLSTISVSGCIDVSDTTLVIDLNNFDYDSLSEEGSNHTVIEYSCLVGNFDQTTVKNIKPGYCSEVVTLQNVFAFQTKKCETEEEYSSNESQSKPEENNDTTEIDASSGSFLTWVVLSYIAMLL